MDAKTAEALEKSIEHWRGNAEGPIEEAGTGASSCPLCDIFNATTEANPCFGCPIYRKTAVRYCKETPHENAWPKIVEWRNNPSGEAESAFREAARAELAFLESLRGSTDAMADAKLEG